MTCTRLQLLGHTHMVVTTTALMWFHKMAKEIWEEHSIEMMWDDFGESSGDQPVYLLAHVGWKDGR